MKESDLVIGKNPYGEEVAIGFNPTQLGINAVEFLVLSLVPTQELKQVIAFGEKNSIIYFTNDWFEATKILSLRDQKERVKTCVLNIMFSDRVIVIKTPPST